MDNVLFKEKKQTQDAHSAAQTHLITSTWQDKSAVMPQSEGPVKKKGLLQRVGAMLTGSTSAGMVTA